MDKLLVFSGKPYDFYKQIDIEDFLNYLKGKYHEHTAKCYLSYFERYAHVFFEFVIYLLFI